MECHFSTPVTLWLPTKVAANIAIGYLPTGKAYRGVTTTLSVLACYSAQKFYSQFENVILSADMAIKNATEDPTTITVIVCVVCSRQLSSTEAGS